MIGNPYNELDDTVKYILWEVAHKEAEYKLAQKKKQALSANLQNKKIIRGNYLVRFGDSCFDSCLNAVADQLFLFPKKQILALKGLLKEFSDMVERFEMVERKREPRLRAKKALQDGQTMTLKNCFIPIG